MTEVKEAPASPLRFPHLPSEEGSRWPFLLENGAKNSIGVFLPCLMLGMSLMLPQTVDGNGPITVKAPGRINTRKHACSMS